MCPNVGPVRGCRVFVCRVHVGRVCMCAECAWRTDARAAVSQRYTNARVAFLPRTHTGDSCSCPCSCSCSCSCSSCSSCSSSSSLSTARLASDTTGLSGGGHCRLDRLSNRRRRRHPCFRGGAPQVSKSARSVAFLLSFSVPQQCVGAACGTSQSAGQSSNSASSTLKSHSTAR